MALMSLMSAGIPLMAFLAIQLPDCSIAELSSPQVFARQEFIETPIATSNESDIGACVASCETQSLCRYVTYKADGFCELHTESSYNQLSVIAFPPRPTTTSTLAPTTTPTSTRILIIGGKNDVKLSKNIYEFIPEGPSMQLISDKRLTYKRSIMEAHVAGDKIIVQGGKKDQHLGETWVLPSLVNDALPGASDFIGHYRGCSGVSQGIFYACSGQGVNQKVPTCTSFDPSSGAFNTISLPKWFWFGACAIQDSKMYVAGGIRQNRGHGYIIDLPSGILSSTIPDIPYILSTSIRIRDVAGVWYHGKFTVCGGRDDKATPDAYTNKCYQLDETNDTWVTFPSLTEPKCDFKMIVWGDKLLAIGGRVEKDAFNTIEVYDSDLGQWYVLYNMTEGLFGSAIVNIGH